MNNMNNFEMVEKLREKANVSYEEAKQALEQCDWDLLDAMVLLEKEGKVNMDYQPEYNTKTESEKESKKYYKKRKEENFFDKLLSGVKNLIKKGNAREVVISYEKKEVLQIPLTILVIALILLAPGVGFLVIATVIAYILGVRFDVRDRYNLEQERLREEKENLEMDERDWDNEDIE